MNNNIEADLRKLKTAIGELESAVVAFSGGVDSTLLLKVCSHVLGKNVLAVTAVSQTYPESERAQAVRLASEMGAEHMIIDTDEINIEGFADNPPDRCYYCKRELFQRLKKIAWERNIEYVAEGSTLSDDSDYRPGRKAITELGIRSPLKEAGLYKEQVRALSKYLGLPNWDKPAYACLSSRIPYGEKITEENLRMVEKAEELLRSLGFRQLRVRHHKDLARIEVPAEEVSRVAEPGLRKGIIEAFKKLGYKYITLDLQGYRTGSMNEILTDDKEG